MNRNDKVRLHLPFGFDEQYTDKGLWNWALAELPDGKVYGVSFTSPCALGVNPTFVEAVLENPDDAMRFEYEPGWVITYEVTEANMGNIVCKLYEQNWFESQRATTMEIALACPQGDWPPPPMEPSQLDAKPSVEIFDEDEQGHVKVILNFENQSFEAWFSDVPTIDNSLNSNGFFAKPGLVIMLKKSPSEIEEAVEKLWNSKWLRYLRPIEAESQNAGNKGVRSQKTK